MARLTTNQERLIKERNVFGVTLTNALVDAINAPYDSGLESAGVIRALGFQSTSSNRFANSAVEIHGSYVLFKDGYQFAIGQTGGLTIGSVRTAKMAFFNSAPVVIPTAVTAPAGITANFRTSINGIITRLKTLGLMANTA